MTKGRANKTTKADRLEKIGSLLADGFMTYEIIEICKKEWKVEDRQIRRYLEMVYKYLAKEIKEKDKDKILLEYDRLIKKYEAKDSKMAYLYRVQRDKILGMSKDRIEHSGNINIETIKLIEVRKDNEGEE